MLKNYNKFINEKYKTGYFNFNGMPFNLSITTNDNKTEVKILYMNKYYADLSIDIHGKDLDKDEFFINPNIDNKMIELLEDQGFIECTCKEIMAGNKKTKSYKLI
jgi:hypothetical protein